MRFLCQMIMGHPLSRGLFVIPKSHVSLQSSRTLKSGWIPTIEAGRLFHSVINK